MIIFTSLFIYIIYWGLKFSKLQFSRKNLINNKAFIQKILLVSFLLLLVLVLNDKCTDFYNYVEIYENASFEMLRTTDQELGYIILNTILQNIISNGVIGVNIIRGITFLIFLKGIYEIRNYVDVGWAFIAFGLMSYSPIFSMPAYMLASACIFLALVYFTKEKYV